MSTVTWQSNELIQSLLPRANFAVDADPMDLAISGGADSMAMLALAVAGGHTVVVHHVDHQLRSTSGAQAAALQAFCESNDIQFQLHTVSVGDGPNLEARARTARFGAMPKGVVTAHTADDQAETVLINMMRGASTDGMSGISAGPNHPLLSLRRSETHAVCTELQLPVLEDESNDDARFVRNRVRAELLPLMNQISQRDVVEVIARNAALASDDSQFLDDLVADVDATDVKTLQVLPPTLQRRGLRRWLETVAGYAPDAAALDRVLQVVDGSRKACELAEIGRVQRSNQTLSIRPFH